jgi:DNA-binding MarR family transcriptional regulator
MADLAHPMHRENGSAGIRRAPRSPGRVVDAADNLLHLVDKPTVRIVETVATLSPELVKAAADLRVVVGRITRRVRQGHEVGELTLSEVSVLARLDREGPATPGRLAEGERVRPQAMATTLATLEQRGLVRRDPDASDGRRALLAVTPAGRALLADRRSATTQRIARALGEEFSAAERRRLIAAVALLDRLAERL